MHVFFSIKQPNRESFVSRHLFIYIFNTAYKYCSSVHVNRIVMITRLKHRLLKSFEYLCDKKSVGGKKQQRDILFLAK